MMAVVMQFMPLLPFYLLEARYFSKVEAADLHSRDHHIESLFAGGANGRRKRFHVVQQFDNALIKAEIAQASADAPVLDQKRSIPRHPGHDLFVGIHFADIPETR